MVFPRVLVAIRNSSRAFARAPALSLALLFTIALGVGSNASVYGFVQGLTHPNLALSRVGGVISILGLDRSGQSGPLSSREYHLLNSDTNTFDWIAAARITPGDISMGGRSKVAIIAEVTPDLAAALNLPLRGGVILSHHLGQSELGSRPLLPEDRVRVNHLDLPITGIAPSELAGLYGDQAVDLWMPAQFQSADSSARDLWIVARMRQPVSISRAQAAVRRALGNSSEVTLAPFTGAAPGMVLGLSRIGMLLNFAAGAVFFVASINVASFLFGRALKRSHETSLRIALGATRSQLLGELLSDSILISVAGGILGALLAGFTVHALPALLFEKDAERLVFAPRLLPVITASMLCVCLTILCGMMPVFATVTDRPWIVLGRESGFPSKTAERLRTGLLLGQITSCYALVICAVFLFEGLQAALEASAGRHPGHPILVTVQARSIPALDLNYFSLVERAAKSVAGFQPMAWTARLPGSQPIWKSFRIQPAFSPLRDVTMDIVQLDAGSIQPLESRLIAGRTFGSIDPSQRVAVIDEAAAQELFGRDTVGTTIEDPSGQPVEMIGVVKNGSTGSTGSTDRSNQNHATLFLNPADPSGARQFIPDAHFRAPLISQFAAAELSVNVVTPSYFDALGLSLVSGRMFAVNQAAGMGRVSVINQQAADLYFNGNPFGAGLIDDSGLRTEIIGVVRSRPIGTFQQHEEPAIYLPARQDCVPRMTLILEGAKADPRTLADLRLKIESVPGRDSAPVEVETLEAHLSRSALAPMRIATLLCSALAFLALVLSVLGLFSGQSDAERQHRRELALRIALGAQRWRIVLQVIASAVQTALAGTAIGALVSLALLRVLASQSDLFRSPAAGVWLLVALLPAATAFIASVLPALRASQADPLAIMRDEV